MLQKSILTTLDAVVDHEIESFIIPTFNLPQTPALHSPYKTLLCTLASYITSNPTQMSSKTVTICTNTQEELQLALTEQMEENQIILEEGIGSGVEEGREQERREETKEDFGEGSEERLREGSLRRKESNGEGFQVKSKVRELQGEIKEVNNLDTSRPIEDQQPQVQQSWFMTLLNCRRRN